MKKVLFVLALIMAAFISCSKDEEVPPSTPTPGSPVVFDLDAVPYQHLSDYHFFEGNMADMRPAAGVLPYEVITPLFSDYAKKARFVWMMPGAKATYVNDHSTFDFQDGTVFIKNFYYDHVQPSDTRRLLETRVLIRKNGAWVFCDYVWNAEQTEATLDPVGSYAAVQWTDEHGVLRSVDYRIPSTQECVTCHKSFNVTSPIGPKPQNINSTYAYADGPMDQMAKWVQMGYLNAGYPGTIETVVKWDDPTQDLTKRVRSYIDANCAHCHAEGGYCDYRPMRFAYFETVAPVNLGVCVEPDEDLGPPLTHIIRAGNTQKSVLFYRISSTDEAVRMPLFGRTIVHEEGVQMIGEWITNLTPPCP